MEIDTIAGDPEELAWAAGFFDAEGCFSFTNSGRYASVNAQQTVREPLDRLQAVLGVGKVRGPFSVRSPARPSKKEQYSFYAYGPRAMKVAELLWPYLEGKRDQVAAMNQHVLELNPRVAKSVPVLASRQPPLTRKAELAWAAGFFDGDGCFSYSASVRGMCSAILQRDRPVLDRFIRVVGVGKVYGPYDRPAGGLGGAPFFQYRAHGFEKTQAIAAMLWFKLGSTKRTQAIRVLAERMRKCQRGHDLGVTKRGCPSCVAEAWARKRQAS